MHIPDGWLSLNIIIFLWVVTLIALILAVNSYREKEIDSFSNIGALAAIIFVAQMFNFPIVGGTSGHLLGSSLATITIGVPGAIIAMFLVLLVQALVFADGGIFTLGANTFNMGIVGVLVTYGIMRFTRLEQKKDLNPKLFFSIIFISGFFSVVVASFFAGLELVLSGVTTFQRSMPPILFFHVLIGIGEGLLSMFIIMYLNKIDFPILNHEKTEHKTFITALQQSNKILLGFLSLLLVLTGLALFADPDPDGLSQVGENILQLGSGSTFQLGIADDYAFLGLNNMWGTILSALLGILILSLLIFLPLFFHYSRKTQPSEAP